LDGLFVVIAIVVGIFNYAAKQQKKQGSSGQRTLRQQGTGQRLKRIPDPLKKALVDLEKGWNEGLQGQAVKGEQEAVADEEGLELEDRGRIGSLSYTEQKQSMEGECEEHSFHPKREIKTAQGVKRDMSYEADEGFVFDITGEELRRSIVMAEILGPPRALKRRIR